MAMHDNWDARMDEDMKLRDFSPATRKSYLGVVRLFARWLGRSPTTVTEEDVRRYILFLQEEKRAASSSVNVAVHALRFFVAGTLGHKWPVMDLLHVRRQKKLPVVMSRGEVRDLLATVRNPMQRVALTTIYALGLRLGEALRLETTHVDSARLMIWIRNAKGAKDRGVMLPRPLLQRLRDYWRHHRPRVASPRLFISPHSGLSPHPTLLQKTFKAARTEARINKPATVHTLRHSYATHLLESGVSIRTIQQVLGHRSVQTTMGYTHVTHDASKSLQETLDELMAHI